MFNLKIYKPVINGETRHMKYNTFEVIRSLYYVINGDIYSIKN
jgi:hypothetical protein